MIFRTANKRSKLEREADLRLIVELLPKCKNHNEVREELNKLRPYTLSRQQVNFDIAKAKRVHAYILNKDEERALLADQLLEIASLACKEFKRGKVTPSVKPVSTRLGNPKYLMIMIQALKMRAKILGLYAQTPRADRVRNPRRFFSLDPSVRAIVRTFTRDVSEPESCEKEVFPFGQS